MIYDSSLQSFWKETLSHERLNKYHYKYHFNIYTHKGMY